MSLSIGYTLKQSWQLLHGSKKSLWAPNVVMLLVSGVVFIVFGLIITVLFYKHQGYAPIVSSAVFQAGLNIIVTLVLSLFLAPILAGTLLTAVKRCRGESTELATAFAFRSYWLQTAVALLIFMLLNIAVELLASYCAVIATAISHKLGAFWLIIAVGNFISLLFYSFLLFSLILIVDKNQKAIIALITSARMVASHWIRTTLLYIITFAILMLSCLPFLYAALAFGTLGHIVGAIISIAILIWTLPYCLLILGSTYQQLHQTAFPLVQPK